MLCAPQHWKTTTLVIPGMTFDTRGSTSSLLPVSESLKDTVDRFLPYWKQHIAPVIRSGQRALIVAHGNSQRALAKYLDKVSDEAIVELNIPTGAPLVYELDDQLCPIRHYYLHAANADKNPQPGH